MDKKQGSPEWNKLFGKHFCLKKCTEPSLRSIKSIENPSDDLKMFVVKSKQQMEEMKDELNYTKSLLNDYDIKIWRNHTNSTNLCSSLNRECKRKLNAELCTKAWLKFCTILNSFEIFKDEHFKFKGTVTSVHLCEAPGAFVTCLNHHLVTKFPHINWNWIATTLNPYYDGNSTEAMIDDDRFMKTTIPNWYFGEDFTGDIMNAKNLDHLKEKCSKCDNVALVTADGSIDCFEDPCMQECLVAPLLYWEFIAAINIMPVGATFIIKAFTVLEDFTISLIYLLWCAFSEVNFTKPGPSKPGNSEVYIVCNGFQGFEFLGQEFVDRAMQRTEVLDFKTPLVPLTDIPQEFLSRLIECEEFFIRHQIHAIHSNIDSFQNLPKKKRCSMNRVKDSISQEFLENFHLMPINSDDYVSNRIGFGKQRVPSQYTKEHKHNLFSGNFYERIFQKKASWTEKKDLEGLSAPTKPNVIWFSNPAGDVTNEEVTGWSQVLGKKFEISRNTQFCSNYVMTNLFQARDTTLLKKTSHLSKERGNVVAEFVECEEKFSFRELDAVLKGQACGEITVVQISEEMHNIMIRKENCGSLQLAVEAFRSGLTPPQDTEGINDSSVPSDEQTSKTCSELETVCFCRREGATSKGESQESMELCENAEVFRSVERCLLKRLRETLEKGRLNDVDCTELLVFLAHQSHFCKGYETSKLMLLTALSFTLTTLKGGGMLVCEISDIFTNANAGIFYLLSRVFKRIGLFKATEHPEMPKRVLVCEEFHGSHHVLVSYVKEILEAEIQVIEGAHGEREVIHILPIQYILKDDFLQYLKSTNELHSKIQLNLLRSIHFSKEN